MPKSTATLSMMLVLLVPSMLWAAPRQDNLNDIRGAVYVPAGVYNAPQMWKHFHIRTIRRDFGYAQEIHLNALRLWASYSYWRKHPRRFHHRFNLLLKAAHAHGIRILVSLFENDGAPPTPKNMWNTNPRYAVDIQSPARSIATGNPRLWRRPRKFLVWFMEHYRNDGRLVAIEVMNEPSNSTAKRKGTVPFAESMFKTAKSMQGTVPLTVGSANLKVAKEFIPFGLNIIEIHENFPRSTQAFSRAVDKALVVGKKAGIPVWVTEWQRVRKGGSGWNGAAIPASAKMPDYTSLAATVHRYKIGNFFWSLMVKPAYLRVQRDNGTMSGIFWPNGSVESEKDARAIAQDPTLHLPVKRITGSPVYAVH